MPSIKLTREWELGARFATGGFGRVHEATADDGSPAAIKLIPKVPGAARELLFEELSGYANVVPILDSGEWKTFYVIVMPRADKSLRQHLTEAGGNLAVDETIIVLADIAEALASLATDVVHRDLKPENILLYNGHWCLADFGIARYAEATTAPDTHKFSMTPAYAAPEQWRVERATNPTDVYAFGVVAFEITQGRLPFSGPAFREQHLHEAPPALIGCPPTLASLITECLYKPAAARPSAANVLLRLIAARQPPSQAGMKLQEVQRQVAEKRAQEAARLSAEQTRDENRARLFDVAKASAHSVVAYLHERVLELAPATDVSESGQSLVLALEDAGLIVDHVEMAPANCLDQAGKGAPFDVIAYSAIAARKSPNRSGYEGRSHSLWFCDAHDEGVYRWYELAFMMSPLMGRQFTLVPTALAPNTANARSAISPAMDSCQLAREPVPFDQGEEEQFVERWLEWFASAADGTLSSPRHLPEDSGGRHRKAG